MNSSYPKTYTRAQKDPKFIKRFKSYLIFKFMKNFKNLGHFQKNESPITFEPFDESWIFLWPSIGFWVWEIHLWGFQGPLILHFLKPQGPDLEKGPVKNFDFYKFLKGT